MKKRVLFVVLIAVCAVGVIAQVQIKPAPTGIDIAPPHESPQAIQIGPGHVRPGIVTAGVCDSAAPLLDVLNLMADADFVKDELKYEDDNKLDADAIYKRRLGVIKVLAGKAVKK